MKISLVGTALVASVTFLGGLGGGFLIGRGGADTAGTSAVLADDFEPLSLPIMYDDLGPRLLEAGAISYERMEAALLQSSAPLTKTQKATLRERRPSDPIVIDRANAVFLLDFFWAVGLTNQNRILTEGPMMQRSGGQFERFASTGGWRLGGRPTAELYASSPLVTLSPEQQLRLERVASKVYRPCCDNPTLFPDCNHGMAMLGMLTVLASYDATEGDMLEAAKYANAVWFPDEYRKLAVFFSATQDVEFRDIEPEELLGSRTSSGSAYQAVSTYLESQGLTQPPVPAGGSAC
jgi:hypothetical protein